MEQGEPRFLPPPPPHGPYATKVFGVGEVGLGFHLCLGLILVTATPSHPVTQRAGLDPGLPLGTSGPNHLRLPFGGPQPLKPWRVEPV